MPQSSPTRPSPRLNWLSGIYLGNRLTSSRRRCRASWRTDSPSPTSSVSNSSARSCRTLSRSLAGSSITFSRSRPSRPGGFPTTASPTISSRRSGQWKATSPTDFPGTPITVSGPILPPTCNSSSSSAPWPRAYAASPGWIAVRAGCSNQHFTVDGTLIEAWASLKSFKRKGQKSGAGPDDPGNPTVNFHGEHRANATHQLTTDPEALLARKGKGKEAKLCYSANALVENRNSLLIDFQVEPADGRAERRAAVAMADERLAGSRRITLGGDKGYDTRDFVASCRALNITPHVAQNDARPGGSALDARTTRQPGYAVSQWIRKRIEETFGWMKTVGGLRKTRYRGRKREQIHAYLVGAAYNLLRIARLSAAPA